MEDPQHCLRHICDQTQNIRIHSTVETTKTTMGRVESEQYGFPLKSASVSSLSSSPGGSSMTSQATTLSLKPPPESYSSDQDKDKHYCDEKEEEKEAKNDKNDNNNNNNNNNTDTDRANDWTVPDIKPPPKVPSPKDTLHQRQDDGEEVQTSCCSSITLETELYPTLDRSQQQYPHEFFMIQPGVEVLVRGSHETQDAIDCGFLSPPIVCSDCTLRIRCVRDAAYVLCPLCRAMTPLLDDDSHDDEDKNSADGRKDDTIKTPMTRYGLGLGFTMDSDCSFIDS